MKKTILAVDDQEEILNLLEALLPPSNFTLHKATNGKDTLDLARKLKPDMILLDLLMPDMNGYEVLKALKQDEQTMHIPVIMVSGIEEDCSKVQFAGLCSESYVTKPFIVGQLLPAIDEVFQRQRPAP